MACPSLASMLAKQAAQVAKQPAAPLVFRGIPCSSSHQTPTKSKRTEKYKKDPEIKEYSCPFAMFGVSSCVSSPCFSLWHVFVVA
eukprot:4763027-Amphidinium_carterae.1